jgi:hypothetical protein
MVDIHRDDTTDENTSVSKFHNGTALGQAKLANLLTRDNISTILIVALAAEVLGISDKILILVSGVC